MKTMILIFLDTHKLITLLFFSCVCVCFFFVLLFLIISNQQHSNSCTYIFQELTNMGRKAISKIEKAFLISITIIRIPKKSSKIRCSFVLNQNCQLSNGDTSTLTLKGRLDVLRIIKRWSIGKKKAALIFTKNRIGKKENISQEQYCTNITGVSYLGI